MQGFAQFLDKLLRDLFGVDTGFTQIQQDISGYVEDFSSVVDLVLQGYQQVRGYFSPFVSETAFNFLSLCILMWSIILVARVIKNFVGG